MLVIFLACFAALFSFGALPALAANTGCGPKASTVTCDDVPPDGISYTDTVNTLNVGNSNPGTTTVNSGIEGIHLSRDGGSSSNATASTTYSTAAVDDDNNSNTPAVTVVTDGTNPIKPGGQFIYETGTDAYKIGTTNYTGVQLAQFLQVSSITAGGAVAGSLTINNPGGGQSPADFSTNNAIGISVSSTGGKGGNGGCTTILLATWCDDGRAGGNAGSVAVNNDGKVTTTGISKYGVSAVSQGGTGGDGGGSFGLLFSAAGSGGKGGNGAAVDVNLSADSLIETFGAGAHGVYARSHGGDGGRGGNGAGAVALGDKGGNGGDAGAVTVTNRGIITTHGDRADGIYAESVGAGAGSGSDAGGIFALGGDGGGQSSGNKVTVSNTGSISTDGLSSIGIFAQSVGGGGGDGGTTGGIISVGGRGGSGGNSDEVRVANSGSISTTKEAAIGVFAQSVGGGGGNGGGAYAVGVGLSVAVGGSGGPGGNGGTVYYNQTTDVNLLTAATVHTQGARAFGIQAQSVGGGGGNGGIAFSGTVPAGPISASVALGGHGGNGGVGGKVFVNEKGTVITEGPQSSGIFAQSVGGGGGSGGGSVAVAVGGAYNLGVALGGDGGQGSNADTVNVNVVGSITTSGASSNGILAQSVGGGGGDGGFSVAAAAGGISGTLSLGGTGSIGGKGEAVEVNVKTGDATNPKISTSGDNAVGIFAQSVGGGGGNGGLAGALAGGGGGVGVALGGAGGAGATASTAKVTNQVTIGTTGNNSAGILAQSVGGGGGNGGASLSGTGGVVAISVAVGGSGGAGSNGGTVTVDNSGTIVTGKADDTGGDFGKLSYGILAQSVGGGGGNGGFAVSGALGVSIPDVPSAAAAISVGGKGGGASSGGMVNVINSGNILTQGLGAHAIFAQSVGGGGGNGGFAGSVTLSIPAGGPGNAAFAVAVGGSGSGGGTGGAVNVSSTAAFITTMANGADGIAAQSIGGGGGDGGFAAAGAFGFNPDGVAINVAVAIGGPGGIGGDAGTVDVTNHSTIATAGSNAYGVMAQSVGGGGGNGGLAVTGTITMGETAGAVGVTVGGAGSGGGKGKTITVNNFGAISTTGSDATGILAESIGGRGGNGGLALTAQMTMTTKQSATVGVSVGGGGGTGNTAGQALVTNDVLGSIKTTGFGADGIKAQSIGGGGGNGGLALLAQIGAALPADDKVRTLNVGVSVGGAGGVGGTGDLVHVINAGSINVSGLSSTGIFAQSVGGGGGNGGAAVNAVGMLTDSTNDSSRHVNVTVAVGGAGGSGNFGGVVAVDNSGSILTRGASGYGIFAQSIGGGGGIGGRSNTISMIVTDKCTLPLICKGPKSAGNNISLGATVGGNGGTGGYGQAVTVNNSGTIETFADTSDAIYAQSVGAGGGNGGNGILGSGEILPVPAEMALLPVGSVPIYANLNVEVGGNGGATGNGGTVDVNNSKSIVTHGSNSNGIFAQSVGGGGGVGGKAVIGATGTVGVGGKGGAAGDGSKVTIRELGGATIETYGVASNGIFAQSIGGGGGVAGNVDRALAAKIDLPGGIGSIPALNLGIGLALGQGGGGGGNGGAVDIQVVGNILTHGDSSAGIFAQSVGGGGGVRGGLGNDLPVLNLLSWQIGSNGDTGDAGQVDVNVSGIIATSGNNATGVFAQSAGGAGMAGKVNVTVSGQILTGEILAAEDGTADAQLRGLGSVGITAQSIASDNSKNADITVTINGAGSVVRGGRTADGYSGVGVLFIDGKTNTLTNQGTITTVGGIDGGYAILAAGSDLTHTGGAERIDNFGTVTGAFNLGAGANSFANHLGGFVNFGVQAMVGTDNLFSNDGWMSPGGKARTMDTRLTGVFAQSATGTYGADLDLSKTSAGHEADQLLGSQDMTFTGAVDLTMIGIGKALPGSHQVLLARSDTSLTANALNLTAPATAVATYSLSTTSTDLLLSYDINFAPKYLNPNQTNTGLYINNVQLAGGSPTGKPSLDPVIEALFNQPTLAAYASALDQLSPEPYAANTIGTFYEALEFEKAMMSCRTYDGSARYDAEGECGWARTTASGTDSTATGNNFAYQQVVGGLSTGRQVALGEHVRAGVAASFEGLANSTGPRSQTLGTRVQIGGIVKGVFDDTTLMASLIGGIDMDSVSREIDLPGGPSYRLNGKQNTEFWSAHARLAHTFGDGDAYIRPMLDVGVTQAFANGVSETGGGPVALNVRGSTQTFVTIAPALEIGGELRLDATSVMRPFAKAGLLYVPYGTDPTMAASFAGAPDSVMPFSVAAATDKYAVDVSLGVDYVRENGVSARVMANATIGAKTRSAGISMKVAAPF